MFINGLPCVMTSMHHMVSSPKTERGLYIWFFHFLSFRFFSLGVSVYSPDNTLKQQSSYNTRRSSKQNSCLVIIVSIGMECFRISVGWLLFSGDICSITNMDYKTQRNRHRPGVCYRFSRSVVDKNVLLQAGLGTLAVGIMRRRRRVFYPLGYGSQILI